MFATAYGIATRYTFPVVASIQFRNGDVATSLGAFVAVNADGWIATAAHTFAIAAQRQQHADEIAAHDAAIQALRDNPRLTGKQLTSRIRGLEARANPEWIERMSFWWSVDGVSVAEAHLFQDADLALVRLDPPILLEDGHYPIFKNPDVNVLNGTSLCRVGFPFSSVTATYDIAADAFTFQSGELTFFPIEGIFTRTAISDARDPEGNPVMFLETSSPGLRGQSGGPIFDVHGRVWAIQSQTRHLELGFNPKTRVNGRESIEPQFINLGIGTHVATILSCLRDKGIAHAVSPE